MKRTTRIILIIICTLLIILSAVGVIWAFVNKFGNKAYADYLDVVNDQNAIINFNQQLDIRTIDSNYYGVQVTTNNKGFDFSGRATAEGFLSLYNMSTISGHVYYFYSTLPESLYNSMYLYHHNGTSYDFRINASPQIITLNGNYSTLDCNIHSGYTFNGTYYFNLIDLTQMFGSGNEPNINQCKDLFKCDYYNYTTGTAISINGFDQYNNGAMSVRESMTINTTSANIADNLDNEVINSSYGSTSKTLIQGYMVWNTEGNYANCTALFNLQTNFNEGDYFEFEFYTITGADTLSLPNQSFTMDLQIIAVDSSGNIVPLTTIKAQNNATTPTKATFYLPFDTDKLYITTPHRYIVGYNNFNINITTTNLTALSLYSYQDGYRSGRSNGYTAGYNKGLSETNATLGTMEYIGAAFSGIGEVLQIELLPGVPFSLFILLPLMFGLIAFVVKLSKGGS